MQTVIIKQQLLTIASSLILLISGCQKTVKDPSDHGVSSVPSDGLENELLAARNASGNKQVHYPAEDPGAPLYLRATTTLNQLFVADGWLVIPFYRNPSCVRTDFNLLQLFDVPAAFSCPLTVTGYYMIEKDAPLGTFPIIAQSSGTAVPFWFVRWTDFQTIAADGIVTITELQSLHPLTGTAHQFKETLKPRFDQHHVQINATGLLQDGRSFSFHVTHVGDQTKSILLSIK